MPECTGSERLFVAGMTASYRQQTISTIHDSWESGGSDNGRSIPTTRTTRTVILVFIILSLSFANFWCCDSIIVPVAHVDGHMNDESAIPHRREVENHPNYTGHATILPNTAIPPTHPSALSINEHINGTLVVNVSEHQRPPPFSAFCLLIRDDNDLLPEWLAYHYHVMNMRRLIVAVDPFSRTTPKAILEQWKDEFSSSSASPSSSQADMEHNHHEGEGIFNANYDDFEYELWNDTDYMPDFFLRRDNGVEHGGRPNQKVPFLLSRKEVRQFRKGLLQARNGPGKGNSTTTTGSTKNKTTAGIDEDDETEFDAKLLQISHHRFRQKVFLSSCYKRLKETSSNITTSFWTVHVDSDEFVVINPRLRAQPEVLRTVEVEDDMRNNSVPTISRNGKSDRVTAVDDTETMLRSGISLPKIPMAGSLLVLLHDILREFPVEMESSACVMMPTLLFGSKEDDEGHVDGKTVLDPSRNHHSTLRHWNRSHFETLRWIYHSGYSGSDSRSTGSYPKAIVNLAAYPIDHRIFRQQQVHSIHRPLRKNDGDGSPHEKYLGCPIVGGKDSNNNLFEDPPQWKSDDETWRRDRVNRQRSDRHRILLSRPLSVNHYLGSFERYMSRQDPRRSQEIYLHKANHSNGPEKDDDGWMAGWLTSFAEKHGIEKTQRLLLGVG